MRAPEQLLAAMSIAAAPPGLPMVTDQGPAPAPSWFVGCHGLLYNFALIVPSALFVAYLASLARRSFAKLTSGQSYLMVVYYGLLWIVILLNLLWCLVQVLYHLLLLLFATIFFLLFGTCMIMQTWFFNAFTLLCVYAQ